MLKAFLFFVLLVSVFRIGWKCYESTVKSGFENYESWIMGTIADAVLSFGAITLLVI